MWQYVLLTLRRQRSRGILASGGFLLAACALILLSATTQTTVLTSNQIISKNWRSTYDLVVLPAQSQLHSQSLVPADQFESYNGGISIQQYAQIKHISGIAVAAPLAVIGYAPYPSTGAEFPTHPLTPGFYKFDWTLTAFNGRQNITEYSSSLYVFVSSTELPANLLTAPKAITQQQIKQLGIDRIYNPKWGVFGVEMPNEGSYLLTAIDPQAEEQLVHLNSSVLNGQKLPEQTTLQRNAIFPSLPLSPSEALPNYNVPMLFNAQPPGRMRLHFTFSRLVTDATTLPQIIKRGGHAYLVHLPRQLLFAGDAPTAQNALQLFAPQAMLVWNGHSWQTGKDQSVVQGGQPLYLSATPSGLAYQPTARPAGVAGVAYTLTPSSTQFVAGSAFGS